MVTQCRQGLFFLPRLIDNSMTPFTANPDTVQNGITRAALACSRSRIGRSDSVNPGALASLVAAALKMFV